MSTQFDPTFCPICGAPNQCAMEIAKATGKPVEACWCVSMDFTDEVLSKVQPQALNKACICQKCAASS